MQHNVKNRTIFCKDNLDILQGLDSESIDLIYLDPPFNKKKKFTALVGSDAEGAEFSDVFRKTDVKDEWLQVIAEDYDTLHELLNAVNKIEGNSSYNFCYLAYMAIRLLECHRVLKDTGSLYLHCDPTMSHYLKLVLDCIFGEQHFQNEVIYAYGAGGNSKNKFPRKHDILLFYSKSGKHFFNKNHTLMRVPYNQSTVDMHYQHKDEHGRKYRKQTKNGKEYITYADDGKLVTDVWTDIKAQKATSPRSPESTGYPTQKPLDLLRRIIIASSQKSDIVLDPFCGCATTCVAAEQLGRKWIGIDISRKSYQLAQKRLSKEVEWEGSLFHENLVTFQTETPKRTML